MLQRQPQLAGYVSIAKAILGGFKLQQGYRVVQTL